jgi:hypothetical protein
MTSGPLYEGYEYETGAFYINVPQLKETETVLLIKSYDFFIGLQYIVNDQYIGFEIKLTCENDSYVRGN